MFKFLKKIKGQSTLEYAVLIIIVIGALLSIQVYIKRGIQGRLRSAADDIGEQYSVGNMNVRTLTSTSGVTNESFARGISRTDLMCAEVTTTISNQEIYNVQQEYWG